MAEIYIRRRTERRGCRRSVVVTAALAALLAAGVAIFLRGRSQPSGTAAGAPPEKPRSARTETPPPARLTQSSQATATSPAPAHTSADRRKLQEVRELFRNGELLAARQAAYPLLQSADPEIRRSAESLLGKINTQLVFSPAPMPEKVDYTVRPGDSLARIARRFNTTVELLQKINGITGSLIRVNDRLRVLQGRFRVKVNISDNTLTVYLNDRFFKKYRVGTGRYLSTPTGKFRITERLVHPVWWRPDGRKVPYGDPENVLGTHWLSLNIPGYGIHGTWEPESVGKHSSQGCIRLTNPDIEELYTLLPVGTEVEIVK